METLCRVLLFALVVLLLPAALLCGVHWLAATYAPGFAAACSTVYLTACTAMAPYAPWAIAYAALAWVAGWLFLEL